MSAKLEELINAANQNIAELNFEQAIKYLEEAYQIDNNNNEVLKNLGLCYYNLQKNTKANEFFTKALNVNPEDATSLYYAASINILNMDLETAKAQFQKVIQLRPEYLDAYKNLGIVYFNLKQAGNAVEVLQKGVKYSKDSPEYYRLFASAYIVSRQNEKAIELLKDFIKRSGIETSEICNLLGSAYLGLKNKEEARKYYLKAVELNNKNDIAKKALALLDNIENDVLIELRTLVINKVPVHEIIDVANQLYKNDKINEAIGFLSFAIHNGYDDTKILYQISLLHEAKGNLDDAMKYLHQIVSTSKPTKEVELKIAKLFLQLGKINEAFNIFNKLIKRYPYDTEVYYEFAMAFVSYGDNIKAEEYLKKVIAMNPEDDYAILAHKDLGCIYLGQNNMEYAKEEFEMAYNLAPDDDIICYEYASYHFIAGDYETALKYYKEAITINPYEDEFKVAIALLYNNLKRYNLTIDLLMPLLPKAQVLPKVAYPLAVAFYETGQYELAQKLFINYCELTQDIEVYNLLALTYEKMGQYEDAISISNKILKEFPNNINILSNKARYLYKIQKFAEAEEIYLAILCQLSEYEEAILGLVEVYQESNQLHKAKDLIARLEFDNFSDNAVAIFEKIKILQI